MDAQAKLLNEYYKDKNPEITTKKLKRNKDGIPIYNNTPEEEEKERYARKLLEEIAKIEAEEYFDDKEQFPELINQDNVI